MPGNGARIGREIEVEIERTRARLAAIEAERKGLEAVLRDLRFSSSTMSTSWCRCWRAWQQSGERDIERLATLLSRPCPIRTKLDDCENRNLPIIVFVETAHLALLQT